MADSIVQGLFGVDPAQYQQKQQALLENQAMQFAQMTPMQRAQYGIFKGASQVGTGVGGMLGMQDPQLQKASTIKQLATKFDTTTPQGLQQFAQAAVQAGYPDVAQQAVTFAQDMMVKQATVSQKMGENINSLISSGKFTPDSLAKYKETRDPSDLVLAVVPEKLGESTIKEISTAEKTNKILTSTNTALDNWIKETEEGKIQFGLGTRIGAQYQRLTGKQDANTRKLDSLNKFLENERNNILMAAKGTQTEGDAQRAMNQIMSNTDFNNQESVAQALKDLRDYKNTQIEGNNTFIDSMRGTRKLAPGGGQPAAPVLSKAATYARVRASQGWENATDKEIDDAIKSGKIKVGATK